MQAPRIEHYLAKAYFWQFRIRSKLHWLVGSPLGFTPVLFVLAYAQVSWSPYLDLIFETSLIGSSLLVLGFVASKNGLRLTLGGRLELHLHLPRAFVANHRQHAAESFVKNVSETILWARQSGFRTVIMESPLLHKAGRRSKIAADLQGMCGDGVSVTSVDALRRLTPLEHQAFMLQRRRWWNALFGNAPIAFVRNWAVPARRVDGLRRERGRLMSGRIVVSFQDTAQAVTAVTSVPALLT
ncbi:hypothetical protein K2O51_31775 (plasmid) [Cupriavidus pinatubonensis]|uniref:hypothetical protein n=1 Tax=Cupriavidus pinatubonensis TaxID=248026 RepID=UPI001C72F922|nr:hypothetical protein [Cupriavidus pinatubonensis]QYY33606.1 hypothetical protein K2O51_31775 [Cupriavidus pinatubonensis]